MTLDLVSRPRAALCVAFAVTAVLSGFASSPAVAATRHPAVTAEDLGYPYPDAPDCDETNGHHCVKDQWGFVQGQCHSWVAYRVNELNADELDGSTFGDYWHLPAGEEWGSVWHWSQAATDAGVTQDDTPALGSLAWWSADGGHVAYVESVNRDGSVTISEMNADFHNGFDFATLTRTGRWPDEFLHVADRPAGSGIPLAPTNVTASVVASRRVKVKWTAPTRNGTAVTGYEVTASPGGAVQSVTGAHAAVFRHLSTSTSYTFTVHATSANGDGFESDTSNAVVPAAAGVRRV